MRNIKGLRDNPQRRGEGKRVRPIYHRVVLSSETDDVVKGAVFKYTVHGIPEFV